MRPLKWLLICAASDAVPALVISTFRPWRDLWSWHGIEWLTAVPIAVFCLGWWICLSIGATRLLPGRLARLDWRIAVILIATLLSVAVIPIGFAFDLNDGTMGFIKDVFAGWVGGVAFFGLVGIVASVASLVNAAEDQFDARARVLVRGRTGGHIDDFIDQLRSTLAHYAESVTRILEVQDYDRAADMYLVRIDVTTVIRSYVDDIDTAYSSSVSYKPDFSPPPGRHHKLIRLTGVDWDGRQIETTTDDAIHLGYTAAIPRGASREVEFTLEIWVKAGVEAVTYSPVRYSQSTRVEIGTKLAHEIPIRSRWMQEKLSTAKVTAGRPQTFSQRDLKSGDRVHTLFLDPPP